MRAGSLFSGIGGFDLGLERAGFEIAWQVEIDEYCRRVLAKHWPDVQRYGDIRAMDYGTVQPIDILCGGFPCQDLSFAGKRAGIDGARSGLWSEYLRAIVQLRPLYVLVENVPGLLTNQYMGRVLGDLAACGYDAEWDCLPASAVGAPHRRDRVWLLAYPESVRSQGGRKRFRGICEARNNFYESACSGETDRRWGDMWQPEPNVGRVADGVPSRVDRLKGLGNAIVPQIAEALGRMILEQEAACNDLV